MILFAWFCFILSASRDSSLPFSLYFFPHLFSQFPVFISPWLFLSLFYFYLFYLFFLIFLCLLFSAFLITSSLLLSPSNRDRLPSTHPPLLYENFRPFYFLQGKEGVGSRYGKSQRKAHIHSPSPRSPCRVRRRIGLTRQCIVLIGSSSHRDGCCLFFSLISGPYLDAFPLQTLHLAPTQSCMRFNSWSGVYCLSTL